MALFLVAPVFAQLLWWGFSLIRLTPQLISQLIPD